MQKTIKNRTGFSALRSNPGFTIVEILIVIVVIGILAAIVIVSYNGISARARAASLQSDLKNAATILEMDKTTNGTYPASASAANDGKGLPVSAGNSYDYVYTSGTDTYSLTATNDNIAYAIKSDDTTPRLVEALQNVVFSNQELYVAYPGESQTACKTWSATGGNTIKSFYINQATESGYDNFIVSADGVEVYNDSGTITNFQVNISSAPATTLQACVTSDESVQEGFGGEVISVDYRNFVAAPVVDPPLPPSQPIDYNDPDNWLTIGDQVWTKYNLNVGTRISSELNQTNNGGANVIEKYCYGDTDAGCTNTDSNGIPYGALYQWDEAMGYTNTEGAQGICPAGSHIPSNDDWKILEVSLGMTQAQADVGGAWRGTNQGTQLKSGGSSGLNVPLAGYRRPNGLFYDLSSYAYLWSSSDWSYPELSDISWLRHLSTSEAGVGLDTDSKTDGLSVRCLRSIYTN